MTKDRLDKSESIGKRTLKMMSLFKSEAGKSKYRDNPVKMVLFP